MATQIKSVIIVGAGGNVGKVIMPDFLKSNLEVSVLTRPESKSEFPSGVKVVKASYEPSELKKAFTGQDAVLSLLTSSALGEQNKLVDAAVEAGVKWFIPSEFGSDTRDEKISGYVGSLFAHKIDTVKYLKTKESSGLAWTAFITGMFFDFCMQVGFFGFSIKERTAEIWDEGDSKVATTNLPTIGKAVINLLISSKALDECKNRYVAIKSYTVSQNEILRILEDLTGEKWKQTHVDAEEEGKKGQEMLARGEFTLPAFRGVILGPQLGRRGWGDHEKNGGLDNDLLLPGNHEDLRAQLKGFVDAAK